MQFLHPEILWGLAAVSIPVLVHLFNFRKFRRVAFSNVGFLKEIKQETQSKSRIRHLLILLMRMLAITCLVFAFAQPFFPSGEEQVSEGAQAVSIYIDNSFSMEAENEDGQLLELAKNKALEIIEVFSPTDQFQLITNDFEGRHQRLVNREEMVDLIEEVHVSPHVRLLSEVIMRQKDALSRSAGNRRSSYVISDLQKSTHDFASIENDSALVVRLVPSAVENAANIYIDSVWFDTPVRKLNQSEKLNIRLRNTSKKSAENIPLKLTIGGKQKAIGSFAITPGAVTDTALYYSHSEAGFKSARLHIDDHPIVFDDDFYFSYEVAEEIRVLELTGPESGKNFRYIFEDDTYYDYSAVAVNAVDYSTLAEYDLIILNQLNRFSSGLASEVKNFTANGGSLLLIPGSALDITSCNELLGALNSPLIQVRKSPGGELAMDVSELNLDHPIYQGIFTDLPRNVDLPQARTWYERYSNNRSGEQVLLGFRNGKTFLSSQAFGDGQFYWCASPLDRSHGNFAQHSFFATSSLRIAEASKPGSELYYTIGREGAITLRNVQAPGDQVFHIRNQSTGEEFLPEHRRIGGNTELFPRQELLIAGNYTIQLQNVDVGVASFNYARGESELRTYPVDGLRETLDEAGLSSFSVVDASLESLKKQVGELDTGFQMWYSFIILALIFLALEILLIKFWRR